MEDQYFLEKQAIYLLGKANGDIREAAEKLAPFVGHIGNYSVRLARTETILQSVLENYEQEKKGENRETD